MLCVMFFVMLVMLCRVWKEWLVDNDTFSGLQYSMGEACSSSDREAKVGGRLV